MSRVTCKNTSCPLLDQARHCVGLFFAYYLRDKPAAVRHPRAALNVPRTVGRAPRRFFPRRAPRSAPRDPCRAVRVPQPIEANPRILAAYPAPIRAARGHAPPSGCKSRFHTNNTVLKQMALTDLKKCYIGPK